jgi:hypothetical protein
MTLEAAEHRRVKREAMERRNAAARRRRAERWCRDYPAEVLEWRTAWGNVRYTVKAVGFSPVTEPFLEDAVARLIATIAHFRASGATHGPTGGRIRGI